MDDIRPPEIDAPEFFKNLLFNFDGASEFKAELMSYWYTVDLACADGSVTRVRFTNSELLFVGSPVTFTFHDTGKKIIGFIETIIERALA